jgi:hypothetical protein
MIKTSNFTKKISATALALSLVCLSVKNVYADRIVSTIPTDKGGITIFQIGCAVSLKKPSCNTDKKYVLPEANDYGNFNLEPNQVAQISVVNSDPKNVEFNVDIEIKGYIAAKGLDTLVTIATIRNVNSSNSKKPFAIKNNFAKAVRTFISVNNLTIDASPALKKTAEIKVVGVSATTEEDYVTKDVWERALVAGEAIAKEYGYSQAFGCTVSVLNEQCTALMGYRISRGESVNVTVDFGPNPPKNARADWQVIARYTNSDSIGTTLSTVQTSYKNETKTFTNNTGSIIDISPTIMNFTHKDGSTSKAQVTISSAPNFKK